MPGVRGSIPSQVRYIINNDMYDDVTLTKKLETNMQGGNMLIHNFKHCTVNVKITLLKTSYCCPIGIEFGKSTISKVHVAFNKECKAFMNVPSDFSPSWLFLGCDAMNLVYEKDLKIIKCVNFKLI